jgi:hypothetical protein
MGILLSRSLNKTIGIYCVHVVLISLLIYSRKWLKFFSLLSSSLDRINERAITPKLILPSTLYLQLSPLYDTTLPHILYISISFHIHLNNPHQTALSYSIIVSGVEAETKALVIRVSRWFDHALVSCASWARREKGACHLYRLIFYYLCLFLL